MLASVLPSVSNLDARASIFIILGLLVIGKKMRRPPSVMDSGLFYVCLCLKCGQSLCQLSRVQRLCVQYGQVPIVGSPLMLSRRWTSVTGVQCAQSPQRCSVVVVVLAMMQR